MVGLSRCGDRVGGNGEGWGNTNTRIAGNHNHGCSMSGHSKSGCSMHCDKHGGDGNGSSNAARSIGDTHQNGTHMQRCIMCGETTDDTGNGPDMPVRSNCGDRMGGNDEGFEQDGA